MAQTDEHLNVKKKFSFLLKFIFFDQKFATDGLRTLCLAWKELDEGEYNKWAETLNQAK